MRTVDREPDVRGRCHAGAWSAAVAIAALQICACAATLGPEMSSGPGSLPSEALEPNLPVASAVPTAPPPTPLLQPSSPVVAAPPASSTPSTPSPAPATAPSPNPFNPPPVPLVGEAPANWDSAFDVLLQGCFSNQEEQRSDMLHGTIFAMVFAGTSVAVGAVIISQKDLDATTIAIGTIGVVAAAGEVGGLISSLRAVASASKEDRSREQVLDAAWSSSDASTRLNLVQSLAGTCGEQERLAADLQALGPPPSAPPPPHP